MFLFLGFYILEEICEQAWELERFCIKGARKEFLIFVDFFRILNCAGHSCALIQSSHGAPTKLGAGKTSASMLLDVMEFPQMNSHSLKVVGTIP